MSVSEFQDYFEARRLRPCLKNFSEFHFDFLKQKNENTFDGQNLFLSSGFPPLTTRDLFIKNNYAKLQTYWMSKGKALNTKISFKTYLRC